MALPALGNRIASRGQSKCQPRAHRVPAAGTRSPSPWEHYSQPLGTLFPAAGNSIPGRWDFIPRGRVSFPDFTRHFLSTLPETVDTYVLAILIR